MKKFTLASLRKAVKAMKSYNEAHEKCRYVLLTPSGIVCECQYVYKL
jgi:hypothetical protein